MRTLHINGLLRFWSLSEIVAGNVHHFTSGREQRQKTDFTYCLLPVANGLLHELPKNLLQHSTTLEGDAV
jgi:hypothetical protein